MKLKLAAGLVYVAFALFAFVALAPKLIPSAAVILGRYSYAPNLSLPYLWLALALLLALGVADVVRRLARSRRVGLARYALLLVFSGASVGATRLLRAPRRPSVTDGLTAAVARTAFAADRAFARDHAYPADVQALRLRLPAAVRHLGFRSRGALPLPTRVAVVPDALEPVLVAPPGVGPGALVLAVDRARRRYWVTAFGLDPGGRVRVVVDAGRLLLAEGIDGEPRSRLDETFPIYPHKMPLGVGITGAARH